MKRNPCMPCLLLAGNPGPRPSRLKDPGDLAELGTLQKYEIERDSDGVVEMHFFGDGVADGPPLFWSPKLKTLLTFPHGRKVKVKEIPGGLTEAEAGKLFRNEGVDKAAKLYRKWSIHEPIQIGNMKVQDYLLKPYGRAVTIFYDSDKFSPEGTMESYYHPFHKEDRIAFGLKRKDAPVAIAVSGPKLKVTERGIVN